jgi:hypothetical protein
MKLVQYRLTLDVTFDLQDTTEREMEHVLRQSVRHLVKEGLLTGETSATVEDYDFTLKRLESPPSLET